MSLEQKRKITLQLLEEGCLKHPEKRPFDLLLTDFITLKEHWLESEKEIEVLQVSLNQVKNAILLHKLHIWGDRKVYFQEDADLYKVVIV